MRRLLMCLLFALPLGARAQTAGTIVIGPTSTINADQCAAGAGQSYTLAWTVTLDGVAFSTNGEFRIYEQTAPVSGNYCTVGASNQLGAAIPASTVSGSTSVTVADVLNAATLTCSASAATPINVCVHWWSNAAGAAKGYARGTITLDVVAPAAPTVTSVRPDERALYVTIAAGTGGAVADHFRASATGPDLVEHLSGDAGAGQEVRVGGLTNDVAYTVKAYAYTSSGNRSVASADFVPADPLDPWEVTPVNVRDFWEYYKGAAGGRDAGGCQVGGAGVLALLAAASLLRLGRRP